MSFGTRIFQETPNELTSAELLYVQRGAAGVLELQETTAPSSAAGIGKIYVKASDSKLYYMNDSGVESEIPTGAIALTDVNVVGSQAAQLALTAEEGDVAIRTDLNKSYIHNGGVSGTMSDWSELLTPTDAVTSVNGQTGVVSLSTSDISEGSNLYYTTARFDTRFAAKSTTDLAEGTNKYYTDERVDDRVAALLTAGTNITLTYNDAAGTLTIDAAGGSGAVADADYGDITVSGTGTVWTIDNGVVTLAKMANMATASLIYRKTAGAGAPEVNTLATLKTDLGLTGTNSGDQTITLTGDVTGSGTGSFAATIANSAVTLAKMANMATASLIYRKTAGSGAPEVNTLATLKTDLGLTGTNSGDQTITLTGDVTGSGTGSFAATIANSAVTLAKMANMATSSLIYRKTAGSGAPEVNTLATLKTDLGLTGTNSGDQTITLTGDVTGSGTGSFAASIAAAAVTLAKMANLAANSVIGNTTGSAATPAAVTLASAATASSVMFRDSNGNTAINNMVEGFTTTATAAGTTTLTIGATYTQIFTGSSTQTVKLPTTSVLQGQQYLIVNQSTGAVTVQSSGANTITILAAGTSAVFTAAVATPTTAANWISQYAGVNAASGKVGTISNTITFAGTDGTTMTFPSTSKTIAANDGSNWAFASQAAGDIVYANGASSFARLPKGTDGQVLTLASGVPSWATAGGGGNFVKKSSGTSAASNTLTISSLDLDTDLQYVIYVKLLCSSLSAGNTHIMQPNADSNTRYGWSMSGEGNVGFGWNAINTGNNSDTSITIGGNYFRSWYKIEVRKLEASSESDVIFNVEAVQSGDSNGANDKNVRNAQICGIWDITSGNNMTSLKFTISGTANTGDWEYRVYKVTTT